MTVKLESIYQRAIDHYGSQLQSIVAIEEMAELQKELSKFLRGNLDENHMAEEIADVEIMLNQLKLIFDNHNKVGEFVELKLLRLNNRMNEDYE